MNESFEETINGIKKYIGEVDCLYLLGNSKDKVLYLINRVENECKKKINDEELDSPAVTEKEVLPILDIFLSLYIEAAISKEAVEFVIKLCILIDNWNNNTIKLDSISAKSKLIARMYRGHLTTMELLYYTQKLIHRAKQMEHYALPSLELSKHYLDTFDKKD